MRKILAAVLFLFGAFFFARYLKSQDLGFKNLKVLKPADKAELMRVMAAYNKELGVKCEYCHDPKDWAKEHNDKFTMARRMQTMVTTINTQFFNYKEAPQVSCVFCHDGKPRPRALRGKG
ncbi:MAG: c-type cytochrome [candidate division Zixibacteria bacterium]|nr:c-type cytochrome [candidate division Zixibacteria bacterium]